ncbi:MAG TPA: GntR family transcriptional regulator [Candidatus Limnocylindria bacterium]|nr:GntR family transcriptional regulator [Candidatus Limnocylindria bacterium]
MVARADISRTSGVPLYLQIRDRVLALIAERGLSPGDPLPSETELQETFAVSRATIRHTLALLERDGSVERHQGKGTYVALPRLARTLPELTSFSEHLAEQRLRSSSRLLAFERLEPGERTRRPIVEDEPDLPALFGASAVVRFARLRLANEAPIGIHVTGTPADVAIDIGLNERRLREDGRFSFYSALEANGHRLDAAEEHLVARAAGPGEARLLGVSPRAPVMSVLRLTRDTSGALVEGVRAVYLGDKYDYVVQLERRARR